MKPQETFATYLAAVDELQPTMGEREELDRQTEATQSAALIARLEARIRSSDRMVALMAAMYCAIFVAGLVAALRLSNNTAALAAVLGVDGVSLSTVVWRLMSLWREKSMLDVLVTVLPGLSPRERIRAIQGVYFKAMSATATSNAPSRRPPKKTKIASPK
jgi:hypothetical protein